MKRIFTIAILFGFIVPLLQAQTPVKFSSKQAYHKHVRANSAVTHGQLSHYGGAHGALSGVDYQLVRRTNVPKTALPTTSVMRNKHIWFTRAKRNLKAWNLHRKRRQFDRISLRKKFERQVIAQAKLRLPLLQSKHAFTVKNLQDFKPFPHQQPKPEIPFVAEPGIIAFRGIALSEDGNAIRNILVNGLRRQDVGEENNTLRIAYASPGGYYAIRYIVDNPVINVTYGPNSAAYWGARRLSSDLPILTIIKVRGKFTGDSMETIVEDIPASDIEELIVRVNIQGNLTWCKVQLNPDNTFTLTPYQPIYSRK